MPFNGDDLHDVEYVTGQLTRYGTIDQRVMDLLEPLAGINEALRNDQLPMVRDLVRLRTAVHALLNDHVAWSKVKP